MTKQEVIKKLKELGITTKNVFEKARLRESATGREFVGMFENELFEDFYFPIENSIYKIPFNPDFKSIHPEEIHMGRDKFKVYEDYWFLVWEDKPFEELPDEPMSKMTMRQYACIELGVPETGIPWLDEIIKKRLR